MQKKVVKKATRAAAKKVLAKTRSLTPKDTGAMARAFGVRAVSRKIKKKTGVIKQGVSKKTGHSYRYEVKTVVGEDFGAKVEISRKSLAKQTENLVMRGKRRRIYMESDKYFYPAFIELGGGGDSGKKPMRTALKMTEAEALAIFKAELRKFLIEQKLRAAAGLPTNDSLKAEAVARGEAFYKDTTGRWQKTTGGFASLADVRDAGLL